MRTKIVFTCLFALLILSSTGYSQDHATNKNEIRLGYGMLTGPEMANSLMSIWPAIGMEIFKDTIKDYTCSFYGTPFFEYNRVLQPWISLGGSLSFNPISTAITSTNKHEFTYNYYLISIMPKVTFFYMNKGIISMYSGLEAGAALILWKDRQGHSTMSDQGFTMAFHVTGFGVRVGKDIGGFMEWGIGFRGVVNFGLSARF